MFGVSNKRIYYINSEDRQSGTSSSFTIAMSVPVTEHYERVTVLAVSIPVSYYLIAVGANTFLLIENHVPTTISITPGNYGITSFCTVVSALLTAASPNHWVYTLSQNNKNTNAVNGLITTTVTGNSSQPGFVFAATNYVNEQFGYPQGSAIQFVSNACTSTQVVNFVNETNLYIHSSISDNGSDDVLQECFQSNQAALSTVSYLATCPLEYSKKLRSRSDQVFSFYLTDSLGAPINLNGLDWTLTLVLYRDESSWVDWLKQLAKIMLLPPSKTP